jgi:hypothetical protein
MRSTGVALTETAPCSVGAGAGGARALIAEMTKCRAVAGEFATAVLPQRRAAPMRQCCLRERDATAASPARLTVPVLAGALMSR